MLALYLYQCTLHVNNMELKFPNQLFINGEFRDAVDGKTYDTINPNDESVSYYCMIQTLCTVLCAATGHL